MITFPLGWRMHVYCIHRICILDDHAFSADLPYALICKCIHSCSIPNYHGLINYCLGWTFANASSGWGVSMGKHFCIVDAISGGDTDPVTHYTVPRHTIRHDESVIRSNTLPYECYTPQRQSPRYYHHPHPVIYTMHHHNIPL